MVKCSLCGREYDDKEAESGCVGCPMSQGCGRIKCPHCGFENVKESKIIEAIKKLREKKDERKTD